MALWHLDCGGFLIGLQVRVNEFDEAIKVFCGDLFTR